MVWNAIPGIRLTCHFVNASSTNGPETNTLVYASSQRVEKCSTFLAGLLGLSHKGTQTAPVSIAPT